MFSDTLRYVIRPIMGRTIKVLGSMYSISKLRDLPGISHPHITNTFVDGNVLHCISYGTYHRFNTDTDEPPLTWKIPRHRYLLQLCEGTISILDIVHDGYTISKYSLDQDSTVTLIDERKKECVDRSWCSRYQWKRMPNSELMRVYVESGQWIEESFIDDTLNILPIPRGSTVLSFPIIEDRSYCMFSPDKDVPRSYSLISTDGKVKDRSIVLSCYVPRSIVIAGTTVMIINGTDVYDDLGNKVITEPFVDRLYGIGRNYMVGHDGTTHNLYSISRKFMVKCSGKQS